MWHKELCEHSKPRIVARTLPLKGVLHDSGSSMKHLAVLLAGFAIFAATLEAQASSSSVPDSHRPPPGMCRIWIDGVPPAHQPAPTDCATAIRKRPMNARVVFGNDAPSANDRGFVPGHVNPSTFAAPAPAVQSRDQQDRAAQLQHDAQSQRDAQIERDARAQRDSQERQRVEAQRQHDEQQKREASRRPPEHVQEHVAPRPPPRIEKSQRPPRRSSSSRRPR
jgi:hypothetical protein